MRIKWPLVVHAREVLGQSLTALCMNQIHSMYEGKDIVLQSYTCITV